MINNVVLTGRITKDPQLRTTQSGKSVANFNIAVDRNSKDNNGERQTDFIQCVAWNKTAELIAKYVRKGSLIGVEGRIQTQNYENQQGQRVYVTEVIINQLTFLESKHQAESNQQYEAPNNQYQQNDPFQENTYSGGGIDDSDLPF